MDEGVEDLQPTLQTAQARNWDWRTFACAWMSMIMQPGSISGGASLLSLGLTVSEASCAHLLGGFILWIFLTLSAWPGVKYGIPFPVVCRSAFGVLGAHFCTLSRGAVAIMWLSFQIWQATLGLHISFGRAFGDTYLEWARINPTLTLGQLLLLLLFVGCHAIAIAFGVRRFRRLIHIVAPIQLVGFGAIVIWLTTVSPIDEAIAVANANVSSLQEPGSPYANNRILSWLMAINVSVGTWSSLVLNVCDLSRFSPTQRDQSIGQLLGLPLPYGLTGFVGLWAAGATQMAFGKASWQIPEYFDSWATPLALLGSFVLALAILAVNVLANLLSPMNDLLNLAPSTFSLRKCGYACLCLSILVRPWELFASQQTFVLRFLGGYTSVTGAIAGVLLTDFWVLRRCTLRPKQLYAPPQLFDRRSATPCLARLQHDANWRALLAVLIACAPMVPGFVSTLSSDSAGRAGQLEMALYSSSWFCTLAVSSTSYWWLITIFPGWRAQEVLLQEGEPEQTHSPSHSTVANISPMVELHT